MTLVARAARLGRAVALSILGACAGGDAVRTSDSAVAPDYTAMTLAGDTVSLASQRGKVVLLNIWATWCVPCREEMPMLQKLHAEYQSRGFSVIGVSIDAHGEQERIRSFAADFGATFPIWLDPDERVAFQFRAIGVPASYLIDRRGSVTWKQLGPIREGDRALTGAIEKAVSDSAGVGAGAPH